MTPILLALALALGLGQDRGEPASVLREADIRIILEESYAAVVCSYVLDRGGDSLVFQAPRFPRQVILVSGAFGPDGELHAVHRLERRLLLAPAGSPGRGIYHLRYNVEGDLSRIPLFVPSATPTADAAIAITIVGAQRLDRDEMQPSLDLQPDGTLRASFPELPEMVQLSAPETAPSIPRILLWLVMLAFVGVSLYFLARALWVRRSRA